MTEIAPNLRVEHFTPRVFSSGALDAATTEYIRAYTYGFYGAEPLQGRIDQTAQYWIKDKAALTATYPDPIENPVEQQYGFGESFPIGTFFTSYGTFSTGQATLKALRCTYATVNPAYRRKGILRHMMVEALERGKAQGAALATLIATEGQIYQRFGFGVASRTAAIKVHTDTTFEITTDKVGTVFTADPSKIGDLAEKTFEQFHVKTSGSISQTARYSDFITGAMLERDGSTMRSKLRVGLYCSPEQHVEGFVVYTVKELDGPFNLGVEIVELISLNTTAYLQLWHFLGTLDLVREVTWDRAPLEDALLVALKNPRHYQVESLNDHSWNRILDVPKAFIARQWGSDGECILHVKDPLGLAAGIWHLKVQQLKAECVPLKQSAKVDHLPTLELSAEHLAPLHSGEADPQQLLLTGQATLTWDSTATDGSADGGEIIRMLKRMFHYGQKPYSVTYF